ncbi:DUF4380 domain-containing protein [Halothermothrix orenii]|uniref:Uncharacterized protein n=1 Tax=Halothermothrix orenii (strain H 168 / OCM 544 / DSM 9562) TaxID=373903 RepID=B8CXN3_HALOH|nr:DUF4380 domain-containing protein [Halothermothrix orenii]ACL70052.1 hypothetical protein Hore_13020 [Halothermothrix orenii H 168]
MIEFKKTEFKGWQGYELKNKVISLILLPEVGGKIVSFSYRGQDLFFNLPENSTSKIDLSRIGDVKSYRKKFDYVPTGGYKTWLAPQSKWDWPPYLDLELGSYNMSVFQEKDKIQVELTSPVCRESGMRLMRVITLKAGSPEVTIKQGMENCSTTDRTFGLWDVTQIHGEGRVIFPILSDDSLGYIVTPEKNNYTERYNFDGKSFISVHCPGQEIFKLGTGYSKGWILTLVEKEDWLLGYLKIFPVFSGARFGHGYAMEVFDTNKYNYFEVEVHGPLNKIRPQDKYFFTEEWRVLSWDKKSDIKEIMETVKSIVPDG